MSLEFLKYTLSSVLKSYEVIKSQWIQWYTVVAEKPNQQSNQN